MSQRANWLLRLPSVALMSITAKGGANLTPSLYQVAASSR